MLKKYYKSISILVFSVFMTSCGLFSNEETDDPGTDSPTEQPSETPDEIDNGEETDTNGQSTEDEVNQDLSAWLPRLDNVVYSYEGIGNEFAEYNWTPQFNQDDYYQVANQNPGTTLVEIFEYREDEIVRTFQRGETYFRDNFTEIGSFSDERQEEVLLKAPIEVGNSWSNEDSDYEITAIDHEIEVPYGTFNAIEVTITTDDAVTKRYYAEDVGLVSEIFESEGMIVESNLESVETDTPEILPFTVFVPDDQAMGMDQVEAELALNTNDPARVAITELLSGQADGFENINILPEGTTINYLFLNNDNIVEVDVSSEFEENMNAGSTGELFAVYTLVNTLSQYYGAQEVLLTVDGEPYEGAHMALQEGETLAFNEDMVN
ncbi:MAG TPA: GerMN domain-containing protein [Atopostipes sp.]|nr:GerMN domain-containing protein [Atopostipes sp.]